MGAHLFLFRAALILYGLAMVLFVLDLVIRHEKANKFARWFIYGGFVIHTLTLIARYVAAGYTPVGSLHESLSFYAWCLTGIYILFDYRYRIQILGAFVSPLSMALMIFGSKLPSTVQKLNPVLDSWWLPVHVTFSFLGNAIFTLAFVVAIMYLLQEGMLKRKKFLPLFYRLPSLDVLDNINYRCLTIGFPLMTMGIVSGAVWANIAWGSYWSWDPKETWALITWFIYAALLHMRLTIGWRGRRAAIFAIVGFLCLLFTFLGVNLLLSGYHTYSSMSG